MIRLLTILSGTINFMNCSGMQVGNIKDVYGYYNIGSYSSSGYFNGLIDEVIIENRAWTATEVLNYYNQSKGVYAPKMI